MVQSLYLSKENKSAKFDVSWSAQVIQALWDFVGTLE